MYWGFQAHQKRETARNCGPLVGFEMQKPIIKEMYMFIWEDIKLDIGYIHIVIHKTFFMWFRSSWWLQDWLPQFVRLFRIPTEDGKYGYSLNPTANRFERRNQLMDQLGHHKINHKFIQIPVALIKMRSDKFSSQKRFQRHHLTRANATPSAAVSCRGSAFFRLIG